MTACTLQNHRLFCFLHEISSKLLADFPMTSKCCTQNKASIKFFLGGPENLISCSAFWPSVCELMRRSSMSRISSYRRPKLAWNVLIYFPPFCFYHIIRVILMLQKNSTSFQKATCIFQQKKSRKSNNNR